MSSCCRSIPIDGQQFSAWNRKVLGTRQELLESFDNLCKVQLSLKKIMKTQFFHKTNEFPMNKNWFNMKSVICLKSTIFQIFANNWLIWCVVRYGLFFYLSSLASFNFLQKKSASAGLTVIPDNFSLQK